LAQIEVKDGKEVQVGHRSNLSDDYRILPVP
jgi:hypothetical protein